MPIRRVLEVGEEILRLLQAPLSDEALGEMETLLEEREDLLKAILDAATADRGQLPDQDLLRQLTVQQQALEQAAHRVMGALQVESGGMQVARSSMAAVHRILNPGVRPRMVDERR